LISPAKINLGLNILFKRNDGYHELKSIFLLLDWGDQIEFEEMKGFQLYSEVDPSIPQLKEFHNVSERGDITKNILYKTYQLAFQRKSTRKGISIKLKKNIPTGGGLGGGSSNAAQALKFFFPNEVLPYSKDFLSFASKIGADVPFFLQGSHSLVGGIGEKLDPLQLPTSYGILAIPPFSIETKPAFISLKKPLQETPHSDEWKYLSQSISLSLQKRDWKSLSSLIVNDFEPYAIASFPELRYLRDSMVHSGLDFISMSGTGSCFYGLSSDKNKIMESFQVLSNIFKAYKFVPFNI
jgi:4-diphosphocytidyl-2-C-methyl-D-erythritol kinase